MKYIVLFFVILSTSCSVVKASRGENGKPGENGKSSTSQEKAKDGKKGEDGKSKTIGIKI